MIKSIKNAAHYVWGQQCDGWFLLQAEKLSVIQEFMPAGASEQLHYHEHAQQLFYILSGVAHFEIEGEELTLNASESIHVAAGKKHRIFNLQKDGLMFILVSEPNAHGDRTNC